MEDEIAVVPETHEVNAYLVPKPDEVISWMSDIEDFISTHAFS